jgi:transposase-like protein
MVAAMRQGDTPEARSVIELPISLDDPFPFGDAEWFRDLEGTEERCRAYLEALRWPDGVHCPRCDSADTARLEARKKFYCRSCRYHFSVTSGTLFHNSHLPTWKWFLTISLMIQSEDGLPANQLVDLLGVTYKTAWFAEHRVRAALQGGRVAVTAVPGQTTGRGARARVFSRPLVGSYQQLELKYLPAYMAEIQWRSESRRNPYAFRDTVLRLLGGDPLAYAQLVAGRNPVAVRPSEAPSPEARQSAA